MEKYFSIDNSFQPTIRFTTEGLSLSEAINEVNSHSGNISDETGIVDVLMEGLNSSSQNANCYNALIDIYIANPGENIQYDVINKLTWSESPNAQFLMEEILSDSTYNSLSSQFDEIEKDNILSIMRLDIDERANEIMEQIKSANPDYPTDAPIDYHTIRGKMEGTHISHNYNFKLPDKPNTEGGNGNLDELKDHLIELLQSDFLEAISTLVGQIQDNPDLGRQLGQLMQQDIEFRGLVTDMFLKTAAENPNDESILKNTLSYCRQVGEDISITRMTENQKLELIPKLRGENVGDRIYFAQDDLMTRLDAGEFMSLNTLSNEGLVAIPILLNIKLKL